MVCNRCKMAVQAELDKYHIQASSVELGEVELLKDPGAETLRDLQLSLEQLGFEIIDDRKSQLIERIKNLVVHLVHHSDELIDVNLSTYLSSQLHYEYNYLSNLFSEVEGTTIEKYFITQKIEKVKELLKYNELTLSQIADKLGYSSVGYLSTQFKQQTGLTPSFYKSSKPAQRNNLDDL